MSTTWRRVERQMYIVETLMSAAMPRLTPARRALAARRTAALVQATPAYTDLAAAIEAVVQSHTDLVELRDEWKAQRASAAMHGRQAVEVDNQLDRALSTLFGMLEGYARSLPESDALEAARRLLDWCFPRGAVAITNLPFVEQHEAVLILLGKLRDAASADALDQLGLELAVATVETLNARYGELVTMSRDLTSDRIVEADRTSREAAAAFAAAVLGTFPTNQPDHVAARTELLSPFFDQKAELAKLRRRRSGDELFDLADELVDEDEGLTGEGEGMVDEGPADPAPVAADSVDSVDSADPV